MKRKKIIIKICVWFLLLIMESHEQFHQNNYYIEHDKIVITDYNHTAVLHPEIKVFKFNDTMRMKAINGSAYFTPGVYKNIIINAALFKFAANKYRPFPINVTLDGCEESKSNLFGASSALAHSNFRGCPCPVGEYYISNYALEEDSFPPHLPFGKYKLDVNVRIDDNIFLGRGEWYGSIIPRSKNKK